MRRASIPATIGKWPANNILLGTGLFFYYVSWPPSDMQSENMFTVTQ